MQPTAVLKRGPIRVGRYDLLEGIGNGRLGTLYRAKDRDTGATVAVRILRPAVTADPGRLEQVLDSFRTATTLDHPNLVRALDCGTDATIAYLVSEYVDALSLGQVLARSGRLQEATAVRIVTHVAQGLDYAHRRDVVHGAVRPDAVLVRPDGFAKLAGFGEARDAADPERPERGLCFTAPEQGAGVSVAGVRADVYSLAATLYAAVTGSAPFAWLRPAEIVERKGRDAAPSPREAVPGVSELLDRAVRRGMSPVPARRPASVLGFVKLLPPAIVAVKGSKRRATLGVNTPAPRPTRDRRGANRRVCAVATTCVIDTDLFDGGIGSESWPATVRDVSATGVGVVLARRFEPGTVLAVEAGGGEGEPVRLLLARVVRVQPEDVGHWFHGCEFDRRLTTKETESLL